MKARQSLVRVTAGRYQKASKKEKRKILDEFVQSTGYQRCYASYVWSRHGRPLRVDSKTTLVGDVSKRVRKKREPVYGMFEYACHEGNYAMRNMLSASRAAEAGGSK